MADHKAKVSSMCTDIAKLQASVTLLNHISTATLEPSSTSASLSNSSTLSLQASLLPNPSRDSKFQGHLGLPSFSEGTSMWTPLSLPRHLDPKNKTSSTETWVLRLLVMLSLLLPDFDGRGDPTLFVDWISVMEDYFEWCDMSDAQRIQFAKLKLGTSTVQDYYSHFVEHKLRSAVQEELVVIVSCFIHGLRDDLKHEVSRSCPDVLEDAYYQALGAETYLSPQHSGYSGQLATANQTLPTIDMQTGFLGPSNPPAPPPNKGPAVSTNARIECFHCHAKGHIASRCPQRTLTINTPTSELCEIVEPLEGVYDPNIDDC
ncbi:unnamed protein product [Prunus armeniaca]